MNMLPCPFCGNAEELEYKDLTTYDSYEGHSIVCRVCETHGPIVYVDYDSVPDYPRNQWQLRRAACESKVEEYRQVAIEKWNSRPTFPD